MKINTSIVYRQLPAYPITFMIMKRDDINIIMGKNLKRLRLKAGMTQEAFAELIDVSQGLMPRWELGKTGIGKDILIKFCKALDVQPYEFYLDENTPLPATELEKKALFMARAAESAKLDYIAEEIIEYGSQRIERLKKEPKKSGTNKGRKIRDKAG